MTIGKAIQRGTLVYVYDDKGQQITSISAAGCGEQDGLQGYSATAVNIRRGSLIYIYNEKGHVVNRVPVPAEYPVAA